MAVIRNCILPDDLAYDIPQDQWARFLPNGLLEFGVTDVGQTLAGKFQTISFRRTPPQHVGSGRAIALLESAKWLSPFRAAVPGTVVAVNKELLGRPALVNFDPYGDGWVLRLRPDEPLPWIRGDAAREEYSLRLQQTFRSVAGVNDDFWCVHCSDWDAT
ncbi:MAG: glycine cleavage system protein H [Actinobacteria bacterium]|nr:glycine cleavage system protein H [Actinomycetota bacterium]